MPGNYPAPVGTTAILHAMVHLEQDFTYYLIRNWEISIWENQPGLFVVQQHETTRQKDSSSYPMPPLWQNPQSYNSLGQARQQLEKIVAGLQNPAPARPDRNRRTGQVKPVRVAFSYYRPEALANPETLRRILEGLAPVPQDLARAELVRFFWGQPQPLARQIIENFAAEAPLTYGYWWAWKWLLKQAEVRRDYPLLAVMLARLDQMPRLPGVQPFYWLQRKPAKDTVVYLKRRGRRLLSELAKTNPEVYVRMAFEILRKAGPGRDSLDPAEQWLSFDLLYRQSGRYVQTGHSKGPYVQKLSRLPRSAAAERAGELWLARPVALTALFTEKNMAWQVTEWAANMLRLAGQELPAVSEQQALQFLKSSSAWLGRLALQKLGDTWPEDSVTAAYLFYRASGRTRLTLGSKFVGLNRSPEWRKTFASTLVELVGASFKDLKLTRRGADSLTLLARDLLDECPAHDLLAVIPALALSRSETLQRAARRITAKLDLADLPALLKLGASLNSRQQVTYANLLVTAFNGRTWNFQAARPFTNLPLDFNTLNGWFLDTGWRILGSGNWPQDELNMLLNYVFTDYRMNWLVNSLLAKPAVQGLLASLPEQFNRVLEILARHNQRLPVLMASAYATLVSSFPAEVLLNLINGLDEESWPALREVLPGELRSAGRLSDFWLAVEQTDLTERQAVRVFDSPAIRESFFEVAGAAFIRTGQPGFGRLLVEWLTRRPADFPAGSEYLLQAATSKLPDFREAALNRLSQVGLEMPFALRLAESGLPPVVAFGRKFFADLPAGDARELDYALALCDSPDKPTQFFGREFVQQRWERLVNTPVLERLGEHSDPPVQEEVAARLLDHNISRPEFDRPVLRSRDKGRRAKELVKQRLGRVEAGKLDPAVLLELAHSRTPRDSEWAWQQLARLAQNGTVIEGLQIGEVEGI